MEKSKFEIAARVVHYVSDIAKELIQENPTTENIKQNEELTKVKESCDTVESILLLMWAKDDKIYEQLLERIQNSDTERCNLQLS